MNTRFSERQHLIEAIDTLPDEALIELANFVDYLRYKSSQQIEANNGSSAFLLSIAALGTSAATDTSGRDEEILRSEVDPIRGWSLRSDDPT